MVLDHVHRSRLVVSTAFTEQARQPLVTLTCGSEDFSVGLTPQQARELAAELTQAAEATINEGFMLSYLQGFLGLEPKDAAEALDQGRVYRERAYGGR